MMAVLGGAAARGDGKRAGAAASMLRERNYAGGYTILTDWLWPQQRSTRGGSAALRDRPGPAGAADWGHLGTLEIAGQEQKLHGFTFTLGYSRRMVAEAARSGAGTATGQGLHEAAFQQIVGVPKEILYERMKTLSLGTDERDETCLAPRVSGLCALLGLHAATVPAVPRTDERESGSGREVRAAEFSVRLARTRTRQLKRSECATARVDLRCSQPARAWNHAYKWRCAGMSSSSACSRWRDSRRIRTWMASCARWRGMRTWTGKAAGIRCPGSMRVRTCGCRKLQGKWISARGASGSLCTENRSVDSVLTFPPHHQGIPLGARRAEGKILIHLRQSAPVVETRSLAAYERAANGGGR